MMVLFQHSSVHASDILAPVSSLRGEKNKNNQRRRLQKSQKGESTKLPSSNNYSFHQGKDSHGYDIEKYWFEGITIDHMKARCDADPKCLGFNSNGWMKKYLRPESDWNHWTNVETKGFYVKTNNFSFHQGKDSHGHDIERYWFKGITIDQMKARCDADQNCLGFNSNGWMKYYLRHESDWNHWTNDVTEGFFVKTKTNTCK